MFNIFSKKKVDIYQYTNIGGRDINEDSCGVFGKNEDYCLVVADGLGGHGGGADASKTAVNSVSKCFSEDIIREPDSFRVCFQKANEEVFAMQTPECEMKTTLVALRIQGNMAFWAHVGDSRLYHFVDGKRKEQTFDHSVSQMAVLRGEIKEEEIRGHVDRNRLLRALGRDEEIRIEVSECIELSGNTHAFLLCTDGFWESVYEDEMVDSLNGAKTAKQWIEKMTDYHKKRAKAGSDNNTAIAVIYNGGI